MWIMIDVWFSPFSNKFLMECVDSIELNQTGKYFFNTHCKVHKEFWSEYNFSLKLRHAANIASKNKCKWMSNFQTIHLEVLFIKFLCRLSQTSQIENHLMQVQPCFFSKKMRAFSYIKLSPIKKNGPSLFFLNKTLIGYHTFITQKNNFVEYRQFTLISCLNTTTILSKICFN